MTQTNLNTTNLTKLNSRFIIVLIYLSQFNFNVRYILNKVNIIPNILFRLFNNEPKLRPDISELNNIQKEAVYIIYIYINKNTKIKFIEGYTKNKYYTTVVQKFKEYNERSIKLSFNTNK